MAKNKKKKKSGYNKPDSSPQVIIDEIVNIANKIASADEAGPLWGELHRILLKSPVEPTVAAKIIMHKDVEELNSVVRQLQHGEEVTVESEQKSEPLPELSHETKKQAMRVFRKRVKFIKLDRESQLGVGPLSGGKEAKVDSMMAPHDYPMEVWLALAKDGHLVDDGGGFFHIP
jgi:hypothetical protein